MDTSNAKVTCPLFIGVMIIIQGIINLAFPIPDGSGQFFGSGFSMFFIIGIVEICAGLVLIIIGVINFIRRNREFDKFAEVASEISKDEANNEF